MNNKERLEKLKQFQITEKNESALYSHKVFLAWIDNVAPLLKHDIQHYNNFLNSAQTASTKGLSSRTITHYFDIAKSVVNQAIIELENDITEAKPAQQTINKKESNKSNEWHNKPFGKITIGVIIGVILIIIGFVINHCFKKN